MNNPFERYAPRFAPDDGGGAAAPSAPSGSGVSTPASPSSGASPSPAPSPASAAPASSPGTPSPGVPTATPAGAAPSREPPRATTPTGEDIFSGFDSGDEDDFDLGTEAAAPIVEGLPPATPAAQPAQPVQPTAPVEAAPPQPVAVPTGQQGQQPPAAATPLPTHAEPGRIAESLLQNRAAIIDHLAATQFSLSQGESEALETDAVGAIPKIMARVFVESQAAAMRQMQQVIPAMMTRLAEVTKRNDANQARFYGRWPDIKPDTHGDLVNRLARTYRQMNPQNTLDQMIEELGPIVMMTAKIQPGAVGNGAALVAPAAPGAPPRRPPAPFRPAGAGPSGPSPATATDPWAGLGGDYGEQD